MGQCPLLDCTHSKVPPGSPCHPSHCRRQRCRCRCRSRSHNREGGIKIYSWLPPRPRRRVINLHEVASTCAAAAVCVYAHARTQPCHTTAAMHQRCRCHCGSRSHNREGGIQIYSWLPPRPQRRVINLNVVGSTCVYVCLCTCMRLVVYVFRVFVVSRSARLMHVVFRCNAHCNMIMNARVFSRDVWAAGCVLASEPQLISRGPAGSVRTETFDAT